MCICAFMPQGFSLLRDRIDLQFPRFKDETGRVEIQRDDKLEVVMFRRHQPAKFSPPYKDVQRWISSVHKEVAKERINAFFQVGSMGASGQK